MGQLELTPAERVRQLRTALLTGRGPGASAQEITEHTRNRPLLQAVPVSIEHALVAPPGSELPASNPTATYVGGTQARRADRRAAVLGAVVALLLRAAAVRLLRSSRSGSR